MERKPCLPLPDFPTDLFPGILLKLPVKSLLRFCSVSKTWRCIIHDPKFVKSYKHRSESQILVRDCSPTYAVRCSKTFSVTADHCFPSEFQNPRGVVGCNYGLVFFESMTTRQSRLVLWNPSIRRSRVLPQTPEEVDGHIAIFGWQIEPLTVGIGFDPRTEDYKYVRFASRRYHRDNTKWVSVYTLRTNSWNMIPIKTKGDKPFRIGTFSDERSIHSTCFRGVLYSIAFTSDPTDTTNRKAKLKVVSFDLSSEEFSSANLPAGFRFDGQSVIKCASDDSRLALVNTSANEGWIWWAQVTGGDVTWSKHYKFSSTFPLGRMSYIDLNMARSGGDGGDEAAMVILIRSEAAIIWYNVQSHEKKILLKPQNWSTFCVDVHAIPYVESLLLLC